jgi:hypothetical protein
MGYIKMEILRFEGEPTSAPKARKKKSNLRAFAGLASVAAIAVLGSTLAANITLGTGSLEFGQGIQVTAACDSDITVTPTATFTNAAGAGEFMLSTISFSGFNAATKSNGVGCGGVTMSVNAYGDSAATPLQIATTAGGVAVTTATFALTSRTVGTSSDGTLLGGFGGLSDADTSFGLGLTTPSATSGAVYKITLQSN